MGSINDLIKTAADNIFAGRYTERHGLVTSYDPENYLAKVMLMPEGILTGWSPIETGHVGPNMGVTMGLHPGGGEGGGGGDQVIISFNEGDISTTKIKQRVHDVKDKPPTTQSGEMIFWTKFPNSGFGGGDTSGGSGQQNTGQITKFANDGSHSTADGAGAVRKMDGKGNYQVQSGNQQQDTKVEHNILNQKPPDVQSEDQGGGGGAGDLGGALGGLGGAAGGLGGGGGSGGSSGSPAVPGAGNAATIAGGNGVGDIISLLTGLLAQATALHAAGAGAPGVASIGSTLASMQPTILAAGGTTELASGISNLGTQMAAGAGGTGITGILSSLTGMLSQLGSMGGLSGQQGQIKHYTQLMNQKGVKAAAFQEQHWTTWDMQGVTHSSQTQVTSTAPKIPHNGQVYNSNNVFTTQSDFAASHPKNSDVRLKVNIKDAPSYLDKVMALKVKTFDKHFVGYRDGKQVSLPESRPSIGLIAQEVREHFPELIHGNESTEFLSLDESAVGVVLIKAFQEFVKEVRHDLYALKYVGPLGDGE